MRKKYQGTQVNQRLQNIDILRGFALLGLPTMNMIVFAMPFAAYLNPFALGETSAMDHILFSFFYLFADQKFMGLFTLLFGTSMVLLSEKMQQAGRKAAGVHYIRSFWLLLIGFLHAWFIWEGDVLMFYAAAAFVLYPFKNLPNHFLLALSTILLTSAVYLTVHQDVSEETLGEAARQELMAVYSPSPEQIEQQSALLLGDYQDTVSSARSQFESDPSPQLKAAEIALGQMGVSVMVKILGMMCLGMWLFKSGIIQGHKSTLFYRRLAIAGCLFGLTLSSINLFWNYTQNWQIDAYFQYGMFIKEIGSILMTLGYVGLINLAIKVNWFARLQLWLTYVGQMALTNYLMQSVVCAFIFYGYGLGLHGSLSRLELIPIILGLWVTQIFLSVLWLSHCKQGPLEWLWRCLTYFKVAPLRKTN